VTLNEFVYRIQRQAGDPNGNNLSTEMILEYISDEMSIVSRMFPNEVQVVETASDNKLTSAGIAMINPTSVWVNNSQATKTYHSTMETYIDAGTPVGYVFWCRYQGDVYVSPSGGEVRVIGNFIPPRYSQGDMEKTIVGPIIDAEDDEVPMLEGEPLVVVKYRVLQRTAEELGEFDKAQYYMALADRRRRETQTLWETSTTQSTGMVYGTDL
jgi:hypothetical protein